MHGFKEEGTTTTPFDMAVLNELDRFHLALNVLTRIPRMRGDDRALTAVALFRAKLVEHKQYVRAHGEDMPEIRDWTWTGE